MGANAGHPDPGMAADAGISAAGASTPQAFTPPGALGSPRLHRRVCPSTNLLARELAEAGAPHGTLVTAVEQTAGRGRHDRRWWAPAGSALLMSILLRPPAMGASMRPDLIPLAAGVAVCDAVGHGARVKWPNDIVLERPGPSLAKLAGILAEGRLQAGWLVLGIGVNVAVAPEEVPGELRGQLATMGAGASEIEPLLGRLLGALEGQLEQPADATLDAWRAKDVLRGREVIWEEASVRSAAGGSARQEPGSDDRRRGRAVGVDDSGRLIVERPDGARVTLQAADVHLRGAS